MSLLAGHLVSLISMFVASSYFGINWASGLSFKSADGWCGEGTRGLGVHCFSDYSQYATGILIDLEQGRIPLHPPLSVSVQMAFVELGKLSGNYGLGLGAWLVALALCVAAPAWWAGRHSNVTDRLLLLFLLAFGATPMLITLDRANSAALTVPLLLWFSMSIINDHPRQAVASLVLATLIRPQLALCALVFLAVRDTRRVLHVLGLSLLGMVLSFAVYGPSLVSNLALWWHGLVGYGQTQSPLEAYPGNLSALRTLMLACEFVWTSMLGNAPQTATRVFDLNDAPAAPSIALISGASSILAIGIAAVVASTVVGLYARGNRLSRLGLVTLACATPVLLPTISYTYYAAQLLVPAAIVAMGGRPGAGFYAGGPPTFEKVTRFLFIAAALLTFVPVAAPLSWILPTPAFSEVNLFVSLIGPAWLVLLLVLLMALAVPSRIWAAPSSEHASMETTIMRSSPRAPDDVTFEVNGPADA